MSGGKDIENRTWQTDYRGPIVIHAGAAKTVVNRFVDSGGPALSAMEFSYGSLIGIVDLVDVVPLSQELETNPWAWGPYCWRLANPRPFREPIPAKGKLRLYTLPATMSPRLSAEIDSARDSHPHASAIAWIESDANTEIPSASRTPQRPAASHARSSVRLQSSSSEHLKHQPQVGTSEQVSNQEAHENSHNMFYPVGIRYKRSAESGCRLSLTSRPHDHWFPGRGRR